MLYYSNFYVKPHMTEGKLAINLIKYGSCPMIRLCSLLNTLAHQPNRIINIAGS